ncbi:tyrosine kinase catalytic domain protein [Rhizoctonia solani AG-3 Rhs1AP]|uniref:Tyrosine kinase catalytic domain protein n=1 Tax=Rhizoctonia solani AG-3 Rhs1AP TaxID=1086054 RepID=X8J5Y6_9AGAM|nr:tyrosine kinase catalytic domain protein [Rhizoctonia solani AG-3 Rhs1AP]
MTSSSLYPTTPTQFNRLINSGGDAHQILPTVSLGGSSFDHPAGTKIFYRDYIVSLQNITDIHISIANYILGECSPRRLPCVKDMTVCFHMFDKGIEYYVVDHNSKMILWKTSQAPEAFNNADSSKHEYEYWVHMMNFPGHRFSTSEDFRLLKNILGHTRFNGLCMIPEDLKTEFVNFEPFASSGGLHQTYTTARLWTLVLQQSNTDNVSHNNQILISSEMTVSDILEHIGKRIKNVTELLDLSRCDEYPSQIGGSGDIYAGMLRDGSPVAIKCLRLAISRNAEGRKHAEAFANELYVWSKCDHPNVMGLIGMVKYRNQFAMVSPWMKHGNLEQFLSTRALSREERYRLCIQIVEGLAYLHESKIVHGDLKALNVLMSDENTPRLTDFGSSIVREHSLHFRSSGTERAFTVRWAAPEMLLDEKAKPAYSADIHSLGMTILEVMTGAVPYADTHGLAVYSKIINGMLPNRPEEHMPTGDNQADHLWSLLTYGCWVLKPEDRITASILLDKLKKLLYCH